MRVFYKFLLFFFLVLETLTAQQGWFVLPSSTSNDLYCIYFVNTNTGYAVGRSGTIIKTIDGGYNWTSQNSGTSNNLTGVHFLDENNGYAAGWYDTILKTTNGGNNWTPLSSSTSNWFRGICFTDINTGFLVGTDSVVYKTTNGGSNWIPQTTGIQSNLNAVYFVDSNTGYVSADDGIILKTTNAGGNWTPLYVGYSTQLFSVYFTDAQTGWTVGNPSLFFGSIFSTNDGGTNWIRYIGAPTIALKSVFFTDSQTGYAVGLAGLILKTTDGGAHWNSQNSGTGSSLSSVYFTNTDSGYVVGRDGRFIKTYTGGEVPVVNLISPNGGENFLAGTIQSITWTSDRVDSVELKYSVDNGSNWIEIISSIPAGSGLYDWLIPDTASTQCLVKIISVSDSIYSDVSDNVFTIYNPSVTLTTPNGGEEWSVGSLQNISWSSAAINDISLEYSIDGGMNWQSIISSIPAATGNYSWTIPNSPSDSCLVKIISLNDSTVVDSSDSLFTIYQPFLSLTEPNGGEHWKAGTPQLITWNFDWVDFVKIDYSSNNGSNWIPIVPSVMADSGLFYWITPLTSSELCLVKIQSVNNPSVADTSDAVFTIYQPFISLLTPNGGENWLAGSTQNITWTCDSVNFIKLAYSIDNGINWMEIGDSIVAQSDSFSWLIPDTSSSQCLVKAEDIDDNTVYDISDSLFSITFIDDIPLEKNGLPISYSLMQNYPNPFNPVTEIKYSLPINCFVTLEIWNIKGQKVATLVDEYQKSGNRTIKWNANAFASGTYIYQLKAGDFFKTIKMILLR